MGRSLICTIALVGFLPFTGCQFNEYEVELTPKGDSIQRDLTTWREGGGKAENEEHTPFPEEELNKIAAAYDAPVPANKGVKHHFSKKTSGPMPNDIGGSGHYSHWESELGTVSMYVERFRGNDNLLANMEDRLRAADQLVDLLTRWLESKLKNDPKFPTLKKYLNNHLREDLKNLSLYAWTADVEFSDNMEASQDEAILTRCFMRTGQYLVERNYFTWEQLPILYRAFDESKDDSAVPLLRFIQRFLATKMGVPPNQPIPQNLQFLSDPNALKSSLNGFLRQTKEYRDFLKDRKAKNKDDADPKEPQPADFLGHLLFQVFNYHLSGDRLTVRLNLPHEPLMTNGTWDKSAKQVHWEKSILAANAELSQYPTLFYAIWSEPNDKFQVENFGRIVLKSEKLYDYSLWFHGLSKAEQKEWTTFLGTLRPRQDLSNKLEKFRFSHDPKAKEDNHAASRAIKLLQNSLEPDSQ